MEGQLVKKTYTIDNISLDCWIIQIENKFWLKAHDAVFLDYQNPNEAILKNVPEEARQQWSELRVSLSEIPSVPPNWQPHTVFTSEGGLYRLICRNTKPEAVKFEKWVFDEVLPTLRETGQYKLREQLSIKDEIIARKDKIIEINNEQLALKDELIEIKNARIASKDEIIEIKNEQISHLQDRAAVMHLKNKTKHVFEVYKHRFNNEYIFIRAQSKYLPAALRVVNLELFELLINEINVPNAMNILNRLKAKLREQKIFFEASTNKIAVDANVVEKVGYLIEESRT
jgi:prophage antirepressor-like protein